MSTKAASPEQRTQAVADETDRLLAEAVIHFTDRALGERLNPLIENVKRAAAEAKSASSAVDGVRDDLKAIVALWREGGPPNLRTFVQNAEQRLEGIEGKQQELIDTASREAMEAFTTSLQPLLQATSAAASTTDVASQALSAAANGLAAAQKAPTDVKLLLEQMRALIEKGEGEQRALRTSVERVASSIGTFRQELSLLRSPLEGVQASVEIAKSERQQLVKSFEGVASSLRPLHGCPPLTDLVTQFQGRMDDLRPPVVEIGQKMQELGEQVETIQQTMRSVRLRSTMGLLLTLVAVAGVAGWFVLQLMRR